MKDLDLKRYVIMNEQNRENVVRQLEVDTLFLQRNGIMDYSLLLGICYMTIDCIGHGGHIDGKVATESILVQMGRYIVI